MSRNTLYEDKRLLLVGGEDHMLGKFLQLFDRELVDETPEGEGLVMDWSELFGLERNYTEYPVSMPPESIAENYIQEHFKT
jgi:hypothetical protein